MAKYRSQRIAIAKRCQLLIGSFYGSTRSCPCIFAARCMLTEEERKEMEQEPEVIREREANWEEYRTLNPGIEVDESIDL